MKNEYKKLPNDIFLAIKEATAKHTTDKTETAYKFLRKTVLQLPRKQQKLLRYVIVHKAKDGTGAYSYKVQASYNGNMITVSDATLDKAIYLLTVSITGEAE